MVVVPQSRFVPKPYALIVSVLEQIVDVALTNVELASVPVPTWLLGTTL